MHPRKSLLHANLYVALAGGTAVGFVAGCSASAGPGGGYQTTATEGQPCGLSDGVELCGLATNPGLGQARLICTGGIWMPIEFCGAANNCAVDTANGTVCVSQEDLTSGDDTNSRRRLQADAETDASVPDASTSDALVLPTSSCTDYTVAPANIAQDAPVEIIAKFPDDLKANLNGSVGKDPKFGLVQGPDGNFYSTSQYSGAKEGGTVYRLSPLGDLSLVHAFDKYDYLTGHDPFGGLVVGPDCALYGVQASPHSVFRITLSGQKTMITTTASFEYSSLVLGSDGWLYGLAEGGGEFENKVDGWLTGGVFKVHPETGEFVALASFDGTMGGTPQGSLFEAADGAFYGATRRGGAHDAGTIFRITKAGELSVLHHLSKEKNDIGTLMKGGLHFALNEGLDGKLYGVTDASGQFGSGTVFRISLEGKTEVIKAFNILEGGPKMDCNCGISSPTTPLVRGPDGSFYGQTQIAAPSNKSGFMGSIYTVSPGGEFSLLAYLPTGANHQKMFWGGKYSLAVRDGYLFGVQSGTYEAGYPLGFAFRVKTPAAKQ